MKNVTDVSSEEELLQLRNEGKISEDEYKELLAAIKKSTPSNREGCGKPDLQSFAFEREPKAREIPAPLWIALVSLGLMVLLKVAFVFQVGPAILIDALLSTALLVGLYLGHKWAYVLTIVFVVFGTVLGFSKSAGQGLIILIVDCLVLIPVLVCTEFFFHKSENSYGG